MVASTTRSATWIPSSRTSWATAWTSARVERAVLVARAGERALELGGIGGVGLDRERAALAHAHDRLPAPGDGGRAPPASEEVVEDRAAEVAGAEHERAPARPGGGHSCDEAARAAPMPAATTPATTPSAVSRVRLRLALRRSTRVPIFQTIQPKAA
jgi:hypothetical protein